MEAVFGDGYILKSDPIQIIARIALSLDSIDVRELVTETSEAKFKRSCDYSGADRPTSISWTLDGTEVSEDDNHEVTNTFKTRTDDTSGNTFHVYASTITVTSAVWQDSGTYGCNFNFETGDTAQATLPNVIVVKISGVESACKTSTDGNMDLQCTFESKVPISNINWFKWLNQLDSSTYQNSDFESNKMQSDLAITGGDSSMDGRYYCTAVIDDGIEFKSSVDVRFASLVLKTSMAAPFYAGSKVAITCEAFGRFKSTAILRDGVETGDSKKHKLKVSDDSKGIYTCVGTVVNTCETVETDALTKSGESGIEIIGAIPDIITHPDDVSVNEGESATMSCVAPYLQSVSMKIAWFKVDNDKPNWGKVTIDDDKITSVLQFKIATRSKDQGKYFCKVYYGQSAETDSEYATLSVVAFQHHPVDTYGLIGGKAVFTCSYYSTDQVTFEIKSPDGTTSNAAVEMEYENNEFGVLSTGEITFNNLAVDNDDHEYYCEVAGTAIQSEVGQLYVIYFTMQPSDTWVADGQVAAFTARTKRFDFDDASVEVVWQKNENNVWKDASDDSLYKVLEAKNIDWYTIINIPNYSLSEASEWRVKLNFPSIDGFVGGELMSNTAEVNVHVMTLILSAPDTFETSDFTLVCSVTSKEEPSIKFRVDGREQRGWNVETVFVDNVAQASTTQSLRFFSERVVQCQTTVSYVKIEETVTFPVVKKSCPTLTAPDNGEIVVKDVFDEDGNSIGKSVSLTCNGDNYIPSDDDMVEAECSFSTGNYDKDLTFCTKFSPIDISVLRVTEFYKNAPFCKEGSALKASFESILISEDGTGCGWRNVGFSCYDDDNCEFLPDEAACYFGKNSEGFEGFFVAGAFKFTGDVSQSAQDNPNSDYNKYKSETTELSMKPYWMCTSKRKRRAVEPNRDDEFTTGFLAFSTTSTMSSSSTSTTSSSTTTSPTNESTTNESTTNGSTTNESTTNESTTNESTTNESTTIESTTNESKTLTTESKSEITSESNIPVTNGAVNEEHAFIVETNVVINEETERKTGFSPSSSWASSTEFTILVIGIFAASLLIFGMRKLKQKFDTDYKYHRIVNNETP